jgi:ADP-heptose:LPS heptosyltransferase
MMFRRDCLHFSGEKPCRPNKDENLVCEGCPRYEKVRGRILVVKLAAAGDVLRSTAILPALRLKHPGKALWWLTDKSAQPLLQGNPQIDQVLTTAPYVTSYLAGCTFDAVYSFDMAKDAVAFASVVPCKTRYGFGLSPEGVVAPVHPAAQRWFEMGIFDQVKKANQESYQSHLFRIAELEFRGERPQLCLGDAEKSYADAFYKKNRLSRFKGLVGFNVGSGGRWPMKRWRLDGFCKLAKAFKRRRPKWGILLFGGPEERDLLPALQRKCGGAALSAGAENPLRSFCGLVDLVQTLVTGDTLALHIGVALNKRIVAYFGPTSETEIELYGMGEKVLPSVPCGCYYRGRCTQKKSCMDLLKEEDMLAALLRQTEG